MDEPTPIAPRPPATIRTATGRTLALDRTAVMGVINATPDSFSDGGHHARPDAALAAAERMLAAGAAILDIGGESTRPGADPLPAPEEIARVVPVLETLRRRCPDAVLSIDTRHAAVARAAFDAGAEMVNDVSALSDPAMLGLLVERQAPVVLMHMRGTPATMQADTRYDDIVAEVARVLAERAAHAVAAGLGDGKILVDPGLGFGKSPAGNLTLLRALPALTTLGRPVVIGASRKSFIGAVLGLPVDDRLEGSLAVAAWAAAAGAHVIRAHDVGPTVRVVRMIDAIREARVAV